MEIDDTLTETEMIQWNKALLKSIRTIEDYVYLAEHTHLFHYDIGIYIKMTDKSYLIEYCKHYSDIVYKRIDKKDAHKIDVMLCRLKLELTYLLEDRVEKVFSEDLDDKRECWFKIE